MTAIEWTHRPGTIGETWNLIGGCTKCSPGCDNCYALAMSWRIQNMKKRPERYRGVCEVVTDYVPGQPPKKHPIWTGRINLDYDALELPYRWKKRRTVFVCSMSDLFHEKVPLSYAFRVLDVAATTPHTFLFLTKRAERMRHVVVRWYLRSWGRLAMPTNLWFGVTAENQRQAALRIPYLLQTPAAVRWVSVEPMLSQVEFEHRWLNTCEECGGGGYVSYGTDAYFCGCNGARPLDWVVIGAESGPNRRPWNEAGALNLLAQCESAGIPAFVKQIQLEDGTVSKNPTEWWPGLRKREWPR